MAIAEGQQLADAALPPMVQEAEARAEQKQEEEEEGVRVVVV